MKISVCIIAKNEEKRLKTCLNALQEFDEIVLVDNESSDNTISIAKEFKNVKIYSSKFLGFGKLKQLAVSYAKNDWVFCLDVDEILDFNSLKILKKMDFNNENIVYVINRKNYYKNEWIKTCGFYPDYIVRIFNKKHTTYNDSNVHESVILKKDSQVIKTNIHLHHYSFNSLTEFIKKLDRYTEIYAKNTNKIPSVFSSFFHGIFSFVKFYFFKLGFLDGFKGFMISTYCALNSFYKYAKAYEKNLQTFNLHLFGNDDNIKQYLLTLCDSKKLPINIFIYSDNTELLKYCIVSAYICGKKEYEKSNKVDKFLNLN